MMRIRSLYIHISRSSINASRAPSNWSRDAFVSFLFEEVGSSEGGAKTHLSTLFQTREKTQNETYKYYHV